MKLSEYANFVAILAKKYPDAKVIYAADEEGNYFEEVHYAPSLGQFEDGEFDNEPATGKMNAVCIN